MNKADRIDWIYLALAVLGIFVAGMLTSFHFSASAAKAYCTGAAGCGSVQESEFSRVLGVPISVLGLGSYLAIAVLALLSLRRWSHRDWVPVAVFGLSLCGTLYSLYLTYLEIYVIRAICPWCMASAVITAGIFVAALVDLFLLRRGGAAIGRT